MSGAITLSDGTPKVVDKAIQNLKTVKEARKGICGAMEPLDGIENEADRLIGSLTLVRDVVSLQTAGVGQQAFDIMTLAARLTASMMIMAAENRRTAEPNELRSDDYEYGHLETMHSQLGDANVLLINLVRAVHVGLTGNPRDGFSVERSALVSVNDKIKSATGTNLILYDRLKDRIGQQTDALIKLSDDDAVYVGLPRVSATMVEQWRTTVGEKTGISR
ncbi:hypothetical protein B0H66DRAFT_93264 [Apodospora peruviana]|uniref:Uncharacterized protein n=1 Tax=Apodospora peruviana TaxID=516989 RepID=A0AAE0IU52_9PEZI|nr:hypothetical protein B0H66DRAFT_93264 [Apodospora peruviana]